VRTKSFKCISGIAAWLTVRSNPEKNETSEEGNSTLQQGRYESEWLQYRFHRLTSLRSFMHMTIDTVRIDKWLWAARFFKTRSLATGAVDAGKVRVNGERVKPARSVKVGDRLDIDNGATEWQVTVQGVSEVRGPAPVAQALYSETESSLARRQKEAEQKKYFREPGAGIKGRPTKRNRRILDRSNS
jgi:ribosome-associated heat shock protein Hsp15